MKEKKNSVFSIPPFILLGAFIIFLPFVFFVTYQNIQQQQTHTQTLLLEKGAALIRSFEAGTRAGMRGRFWGNRRLQQLLDETAQQPDIAYLLVTDAQGTVQNHNVGEKIGSKHGQNLDLISVLLSPEIRWRILKGPENQRTFEVYKRFKPSGMAGGGMMMFRGGQRRPPTANQPDSPAEQIIFVGLDMKSLDKAGESTLTSSVTTGLLLFLAGSAGIVLLFLFQNYRTTKSSLSRIKAFSDNLVDNMPIGLIALDADYVVTSINQTAEEILEKNQSALLGQPSENVLPREIHQLLPEKQTTDRLLGYELECEISKDRILPLEISISSVKDEQEKLLGYALLLKNLSEIYELRKEVARSQKLASIGRLAAGVAHEIRNPLSSIKGFATYFRERYKDVEKDRQTANVMINEVDRLDKVVSQLLELARPINIAPQKTKVREFIQSSASLLEQKFQEKQIELQVELLEEDLEVYIDRDRINQVLLNLYLNAIDAVEERGFLKIKYWFDETTQNLGISVIDSGKGINEENFTKIFDPYFTTKPTGTGLGLAIVHNIMEAHKGKIKVDSTPDSGTVFTLSIPNLKQEKSNE